MSDPSNGNERPVGPPVAGWTPRPLPPRSALVGRHCRVEPLDPLEHARDLHEAFSEDVTGASWTYLSRGPFARRGDFERWLEERANEADPSFRAIVAPTTGEALGVAALMRMDPANGVIEVGDITFSPRLQRTVMATEAMSMMMRQVFDELGYRRCEWKCDALNAASRRAAERLGFTFEGVFRQALVCKGRNRDTAWFSIVDGEWPAIRAAHDAWLAPANFDDAGRQRRGLGELVRESRATPITS